MNTCEDSFQELKAFRNKYVPDVFSETVCMISVGDTDEPRKVNRTAIACDLFPGLLLTDCGDLYSVTHAHTGFAAGAGLCLIDALNLAIMLASYADWSTFLTKEDVIAKVPEECQRLASRYLVLNDECRSFCLSEEEGDC